jgi:hypothetical protein
MSIPEEARETTNNSNRDSMNCTLSPSHHAALSHKDHSLGSALPLINLFLLLIITTPCIFQAHHKHKHVHVQTLQLPRTQAEAYTHLFVCSQPHTISFAPLRNLSTPPRNLCYAFLHVPAKRWLLHLRSRCQCLQPHQQRYCKRQC